MKFLYALFLLAWMTILAGCFDDKGNYEYLKTDDIVIRYPMYDVFVNTKEALSISPQYASKSELPLDRSTLTFEWKIGKEVISSDSVLKIPSVELPIGSHRSMFSVIDGRTGIRYVQTFNVQVQSKYENGWMALYRKGGVSDFAYIKGVKRYDYEIYDYVWDWSVDDSVYLKMNGTPLPAGCKKLADHGYKPDKFNAGGVTIIHDGPDGGIELNGFTLIKDYTVRDLFLEETLPDGFELKDIVYAGSGIYALGENGDVYAGRYIDQVFWASRLSHLASHLDGKKLNIDHFIPTEFYQSSFVWLMYSDQERRFLSVYDDDYEIFNPDPDSGANDPEFWKSGTFMYNTYHGNLQGAYKDFVSLDNMTMDVIASGYVNTGAGLHNASYLLVLQDQDGNYFLQKHLDELDRYIPASVVTPLYHKQAPFFKGLVNKNSQFVINARYPYDVFFSSGGVIYGFDPGYGALADAELFVMDDTYRDKTITSMELNNDGSQLGVGFSDGTVIIYKKPNVYQMSDPMYKATEHFKCQKFGDEVIDIIFKNGAAAQGENSPNE